jgi:hypothetical protein
LNESDIVDMIQCMKICAFCGREFGPDEEIFRSTVCAGCGKDARVCRNCTFYRPGDHWDCRETIDEPVREKDCANFCGYFRFRQDGGSGKSRNPEEHGAIESKSDFLKLFNDEQ